MTYILQVFSRYSWQSFWLVVASFMINILALSSALYVIQILNRYISYELDSTLYVLTLGVIVALSFEYVIRLVRSAIADQINFIHHREYSLAIFKKALTVRLDSKINIIKNLLSKAFLLTRNSNSTGGSEILITFIDMIFVVSFILIIFSISNILGIIALSSSILFLTVLFCRRIILKNKLIRSNLEISKTDQLTSDIRLTLESIRTFNAYKTLLEKFNYLHLRQRLIERKIKIISSFFDQFVIILPSLTTVGVIFYGAQEVVDGNLNIGSLIGVNILIARIFGPINRFAYILIKYNDNLSGINSVIKLKSLETEESEGINPKILRGSISFEDVYMSYSDKKVVLYERLNCNLSPGSLVVISGHNGSGKSTLCKSLVGLVKPTKGKIKYDDVSLDKYDISWLRKNISFLPQDIELFNLSLRENILINFENNQLLEGLISLKDLDGLIMTAIKKANLINFINVIPDGLDHMVTNNGRYLPMGIKKRIGLARAILTNGKIVIFDEPTDSLDKEGAKAVYNILNDEIKKGKTIILSSHDSNIINAAGAIIDLSFKPIPRIGIRKKEKKD